MRPMNSSLPALERAIEKVASGLHRTLLQEQGTPYGDEAALKSARDYQLALSGETDDALGVSG